MAAPTKYGKSLKQLAALAGVSDTSLKSHIAQGCPMPATARGVNAWLPKYHQWRADHGKVAPSKSAAPIDAETTKAKRETAKLRNALLSVQLRREMGALIPRTEVVDFCARACLSVRLRLDAIRAKMGSRLQHCTSAQIDEELRREFDALCDDFASGLALAHDRPSTSSETATAPSRTSDPSELASADDEDD